VLFTGCGKHLVESSELRRSILVEENVFEYNLGASILGDPGAVVLHGRLLPRYRLTENLEISAVPLPLFHYRFLNTPAVEIGAHFGSYFLPVPGLSETFSTRNPEYTSGPYKWYVPDNFMLGLQGKARLDEKHYAKFLGSKQLYFDDLNGPLALDFRLGRQVTGATALEVGINSWTLPDDFWAQSRGNEYLNHVDLTLNLHLNGFKHFNLNPYVHVIRYTNSPFYTNSWQAGFLTTLFW
jgi:hypothetical protein